MPYCITLRSRTDALITGWYDGSDSRWSTDRYRQKVFANKRDARPLCDELRSLCPRNAEVINIEAEQDALLSMRFRRCSRPGSSARRKGRCSRRSVKFDRTRSCGRDELPDAG